MKKAMAKRLRDAAAAAGSLTGKRFGLLVASSLVATSAVLAGALTGVGGNDALASLLARQLGAADDAPTVTASLPATPSGEGPSAPRDGSRSPAAPSASQAPAPAPAAGGPESRPTPRPAPPPPAPEAGRVKHVFVISLTSPDYEAAFGAQAEMPYLATTLRPQGELLSDYTLVSEGPLANGIAAIAGQAPSPAMETGCPRFEECVFPVETLTVADQLTLGHFSWHAYVAGMADETGKASNCIHPGQDEPATAEPGAYAATQNPFVYFHSLLDLGDCAANDVPLEQLTADLRKATKTPSYSFVAPTPCDAGATGQCVPGSPAEGAAAADAFLATWVPKILASPAYKADGVLIVAFSGVDPAATDIPSGAERLRTGALLLSPFVSPGTTDAAPYGPYSLLRSIEDLFGLQPLARAGGSKTRSFAPGLLGGGGD